MNGQVITCSPSAYELSRDPNVNQPSRTNKSAMSLTIENLLDGLGRHHVKLDKGFLMVVEDLHDLHQIYLLNFLL